MPDFGSFRGFGEKLVQGQTPTQLGLIGSEVVGLLPILDTYPNAYSAYSLKLLRTLYTSNCLRVRRSSDQAEQDIAFTTAGIIDTTALTSFCGSGDGFVTTWYDQSGNTRNATQTTAANQPKIVSSGNVLLSNTKPTLNFVQSARQSLSFTQNSSTKSVFTVLEYSSNPQADYMFWLGGQDTDYHGDPVTWLSEYASSSVLNGNNRLNGATTNLRTTNKNTGMKIISMVHQSTARLAFIGLGNATFRNWDGNFSELIIYSSDQSANIEGIESNINSYYGIY